MLWRARTTLPDRPGALAALAQECGAARVNILALQVFPAGREVTDELVLDAPAAWTAEDVAVLLKRAGGAATVVQPAQAAALGDQPTRFVEAARAMIAEPMSFPVVLAELFDAEPEWPVGTTPSNTLETRVGDVVVQTHREAPFTTTERARAGALAALVDDVLASRLARTPAVPDSVVPEYVADEHCVYAWVAGSVIGSAVIGERIPDPHGHVRGLRIDVTLPWQRQGIGRRLLVDAARLAGGLGADEILLTTESTNQAVLPMVLAAGLRGRIRMAGDQLTVRVSVRELRSPGAT